MDEMNLSPRERANAAVREFLSSRDWSAQTPARRRILAAFLQLATTRGFDSVTMRTLGRELDMKAPSIYSSFPQGKDEIVAESLRWFTHTFARDLLAGAEEAKSPEEYWAALVRFHLAQQLQRPEADLWDLLVATDKVARFLADEVRDEVGLWMGLHADMYAAAAEEMGYELPVRTTKVIFTLLDGAGRWAGWSGSDDDLAELLDHTVALTRSILEVGSGSRTLA
ncbi:TetR/AcrR family transcriptional regulator [Arthrobacter cupressi]|uniref:Transcriptional regulator, TetR family n=1 Tax=Arthrobacter cupressi TaxID=1045773 RepID=A0A1G8LI37_9MICC|nr:TetR/AcrR family transcriptional regulator [Arthrobacter cupressi]NYD77623.1 AcrR family transcriptional regulator [Arthrobacter cupressi]SDI55107.1 transcriptional regulator, TetR family [Arthrobacter cupressi]